MCRLLHEPPPVASKLVNGATHAVMLPAACEDMEHSVESFTINSSTSGRYLAASPIVVPEGQVWKIFTFQDALTGAWDTSYYTLDSGKDVFIIYSGNQLHIVKNKNLLVKQYIVNSVFQITKQMT